MSVKQVMRTLLTSSCILAFGLAAPVIEERQGTGIGILGSAITGLIQGSQAQPDACATGAGYSPGEKYNRAILQTPSGSYVTVCWSDDTDTVNFGQAEADAANCLTNLHYTQADTCISVEGSSCDNGYIAGGGRLQNMRDLIIGSGTQSAAQLSGDDSATVQYGINALIGTPVRGTGALGPFFFVTNSDGTWKEGDYAAQLQVNWIGEDAC